MGNTISIYEYFSSGTIDSSGSYKKCELPLLLCIAQFVSVLVTFATRMRWSLLTLIFAVVVTTATRSSHVNDSHVQISLPGLDRPNVGQHELQTSTNSKELARKKRLLRRTVQLAKQGRVEEGIFIAKMAKAKGIPTRCFLNRVSRKAECGCFYTMKDGIMDDDLKKECTTTLGTDLVAMKAGCSRMMDKKGSVNVHHLMFAIEETLDTCSVEDIKKLTLAVGPTLPNPAVRAPCPTCRLRHIQNVIDLLQSLDKVLREIFGPRPSNRSSRMLVALELHGYNPKVARLMLYNNMAVSRNRLKRSG